MSILWSLTLSGTLFILLFGLLSVIGARLYRLQAGRLEKLVPGQRAAILCAWSVSPLLISAVSTGLLFTPAGETLIGMHCHLHGCDLHTPVISGPEWLAVLTPFALALSAFPVWVAMKLMRQYREQLYLWPSLSAPAGDYFLIDHNMPVAFTLGLFRPRIYISRGLRQQLSKTDLEVVVQHETAHIRRRDNFTKFIASLSTILFPATDRSRVLSALQFAQEACCDNHAAKLQNNRITVARALLHVNQCAGAYDEVALCGIGSSKIELRIKALLDPPVERLSALKLALLAGAVLLMPPAITEPLHHLIEMFL